MSGRAGDGPSYAGELRFQSRSSEKLSKAYSLVMFDECHDLFEFARRQQHIYPEERSGKTNRSSGLKLQILHRDTDR